jgi:hypothetical protein
MTTAQHTDTLLELRRNFVIDFNWGEWAGPNAAEYWNIIVLIIDRIETGKDGQALIQCIYFS